MESSKLIWHRTGSPNKRDIQHFSAIKTVPFLDLISDYQLSKMVFDVYSFVRYTKTRIINSCGQDIGMIFLTTILSKAPLNYVSEDNHTIQQECTNCQKSRNHLKILSARWMTWRNLHTQDSQLSDATLQNNYRVPLLFSLGGGDFSAMSIHKQMFH
jgi:hypothetical protein